MQVRISSPKCHGVRGIRRLLDRGSYPLHEQSDSSQLEEITFVPCVRDTHRSLWDEVSFIIVILEVFGRVGEHIKRRPVATKVTSLLKCCTPVSPAVNNAGLEWLFGRLTERGSGPPAQYFSESSTYIRKAISIVKCGHARTTDDPVQFFLGLLLRGGVRHHGQHEPAHR